MEVNNGERVHQVDASRSNTRPPSSASSRGRYTPQSSNGSFAVQQQQQYRANSSGRDSQSDRQQQRDLEQRDNSGPSLLQERLREKKAARLSERGQSVDADMGAVSMSSPIRDTAGTVRQARDSSDRPSSRGGRQISKKGMGIKEMEEVCISVQDYDN